MKPTYPTDFFASKNNYSWSDHALITKYSMPGSTLTSKVRASEHVIDIGCGPNYFKNKIPLLLGIDPANDNADLKTRVEDYYPVDKFDVAFCLGSFRYGVREYIKYMIEHTAKNVLKENARIYWRCRTESTGIGLAGNKKRAVGFDVYFWTVEDHYEWAKEFGFRVNDLQIENEHDPDYERIYAEWIR